MKENDGNLVSRRKFLRLAGTIVGGVTLGGGVVVFQQTRPNAHNLNMVWRLNPAFRLKEITANEVELYTHLSSGEILKHRFKGLEADLFRQIDKEEKIGRQVSDFALKHNLSLDDCRKRIVNSVREFDEARLIYTGEKMLVKIVEVKNGQ